MPASKLREATLEVADLRGLNQVIVESIQSGLMTTDAEGRICTRTDSGRRSWAARREPARRAGRGGLGSPLLHPAELQTRAASRVAGAPRALLPAPLRAAARARRLGDAARDPGAGAPRLPARVPGPDRDPPARGAGSHQGEAGGRRGDGGRAGARDPESARLDPRLGPGADGASRRSARSTGGCSRSSRASRSGSRTRSTASSTRRARRCASARRWTCCRSWSRP